MLYKIIVTIIPAPILYQKPNLPIINPNITKNTKDVKTKYTVSKLNLAKVTGSTPLNHMNTIASSAVKGMPIRTAAKVALRNAIILTVATNMPEIIALSKNSIIRL